MAGPEPYISNDEKSPQLSLRALILGLSCALIFGAGNMYLGLKVGMTVTAAIPSVIVAIAFVKKIFRNGSPLETTIVQSIAASGDALMNGVIFTVPALIFLFPNSSLFTLFLYSGIGAFIGAILGIFFTIPLRELLTVREHNTLPYPEGKACANLIIAGDKGGETASPVIWGIGVSSFTQFLSQGLRLWKIDPFWSFKSLGKASIGFETTPIMMGVGYIIGFRIALTMFAGGVLAWFFLIPLFNAIGGTRIGEIISVSQDINQMDSWEIWSNYIRFVGAGAVATGGIISAIKVLPSIYKTLKPIFKNLLSRNEMISEDHGKDIPFPAILLSILVLLFILVFLPSWNLNFGSALTIIVFAFIFSAVSARMVGLIGTTSQPVSGLTIASLMLASVFLFIFGYSGDSGKLAALTVGVTIATAICNSGGLSQDLKTALYIGNSPLKIQIAEILGAGFSATLAGLILIALHKAYTLGSSSFPAPQGRLLQTIIDGIMGGTLPWRLLFVGAIFALIAEFIGISSLSFAIGLYLPISTSSSLIFGGIINSLIKRKVKEGDYEKADKRATLFSSGLIAGGAIIAVFIALLKILGWLDRISLSFILEKYDWLSSGISILVFAFFGFLIYKWALKRRV